ncbi:hypothetical protein FISHEDRAFT_75630 [Fistulina hepatica ATCC 64428]|uniref:Uncharacterized protein n=1 Tax=Fistulina hepatica ATCC 64428 TaxID=1128425 RepID=A0A0D7A6U3_9AGAR|nr:hypothetical protein FISHEDRAFT_75630 [Fistulina hepatica ATCC 64428]
MVHHLLQINSDLPPHAPLFAFKDDSDPRGFTPLTKTTLLDRCNMIWTTAGHIALNGHSFRIGGAVELLLMGIDPRTVALTGGWSSLAFLLYWRRLDEIIPFHTHAAYKSRDFRRVRSAIASFQMLPRSSSEPRFGPEPTGPNPKFGPRSGIFPEPDPKSGSEFGLAKIFRTRFKPANLSAARPRTGVSSPSLPSRAYLKTTLIGRSLSDYSPVFTVDIDCNAKVCACLCSTKLINCIGPRLTSYDRLSSNSLTMLKRVLLYSLSHEPSALVQHKAVNTITDEANKGMTRGRMWHALQAQAIAMAEGELQGMLDPSSAPFRGPQLRSSAFLIFAASPALTANGRYPLHIRIYLRGTAKSIIIPHHVLPGQLLAIRVTSDAVLKRHMYVSWPEPGSEPEPDLGSGSARFGPGFGTLPEPNLKSGSRF